MLVFGATGHTGRLLCKKLFMHSLEIVAAVRNAGERDLSDLGATEVVDVDLEGDLGDISIVPDYVIFAAGSGSKTVADKTVLVDLNGALKAIDWAAKNKIRKFAMLSSMGCDHPDALPKQLRPYLQAKAVTDAALRASPLDHVIVRPARLTFERAARQISAQPNIEQFTPISREDVAEAMVDLLLDPSAANLTIELMGGDTPIREALAHLTQNEVAA